MTEPRLFRVQGSGAYWLADDDHRRGIPPCRCSEADARRAYAGYVARHGRTQSFQRLMVERGGLGPEEMDEYAPGWTRIESYRS